MAEDLFESVKMPPHWRNQGGTAEFIFVPGVFPGGVFFMFRSCTMNRIILTDVTLKDEAENKKNQLSFREKIEIAKLLDKLGIDIIELPVIKDERIDMLLIKSIVSSVRNARVAVTAGFTEESVDCAWNAVRNAEKPRIVIEIPVSSVQMEYICRRKPQHVLELISSLVSRAHSLCDDVEFCAADAMRSESEFLTEAVGAAIAAGAKTVSLCDSAGIMLPEEFMQYISDLYTRIPSLADITLGVKCSDELNMASACSVASVMAGARAFKTTLRGKEAPSIDSISQFFRLRGESCDMKTGLNITELNRAVRQIGLILRHRQSMTAEQTEKNNAPSDIVLSKNDDNAAVIQAIGKLGYELSDEDNAKVCEEFYRVAVRKDVSLKELDAIIATAALQVPPTYMVKSYAVTSGNLITAMASIEMEKDGKILLGVGNGDGPIDAAFKAIEQVAGCHFELDDFQIQAVTQGKEAVGEALVKIRSDGTLFSGTGISTDIVGASIRAYVNALNKIVYEVEDI